MVVVNGFMYAPFAVPGDWQGAYVRFWGVRWGACVAPFAFGIALAVLRRELVPRRSMGRHPALWSLGLASLAALAVMSAINIPRYNSGDWPDHGREILGFWGQFVGAAVGVGAFFFLYPRFDTREVVSVSDPEPPRHKAGLLIAAIVAGIFGLLVGLWNVAWSLDVWSLEGAWLWPLCIVPLVTSLLLARAYVKGRRVGRA